VKKLRLRWRRPPRSAWRLAAVVVLYLLVEQLFAYETRATGLVSPGGTPHYGVLLLGVAFLGLRIVVRFVVPGLVVFLAAQSLAAHLGSSSRSQGS
jgi:hypothetical protein